MKCSGQNCSNTSTGNSVAESVWILFGIPKCAICAFRKFTTRSAVGFATHALFGQLVFWSIDTSNHFLGFCATWKSPANSIASSSLCASAAGSFPNFDCVFRVFKFLPACWHCEQDCASKTISRWIRGHQMPATACSIESRPGWPQWRRLNMGFWSSSGMTNFSSMLMKTFLSNRNSLNLCCQTFGSLFIFWWL